MDSFVVDRFAESSARAVEAATRALALDDPEDWTESVIAQVLAKRGDLHAAEVHLNRALARNPTTAFTLEARGYIYVWHGRAVEALQIGERLLRLDPLDQYHHTDLLAYANYLVGNYERSLTFFRRIGQMHWLPDHAYLAACLGQLGRVEEAQATWRRGLELMPGFSRSSWRSWRSAISGIASTGSTACARRACRNSDPSTFGCVKASRKWH